MPVFRDERRVRHNAVQMFDLVADVERYPEFVPLCKALRVRSRRLEADGRETLVADMTVGYKLIRETFTSRVSLDKPNLKLRVEYIDGPFSRLENIWTFRDEADGQGSRVSFFIDYEFKSRTLGLLMGSMFDAAFRKFAGAFEDRADAIYGRCVIPDSARICALLLWGRAQGRHCSGRLESRPPGRLRGLGRGSSGFLRHLRHGIRIDDHHRPSCPAHPWPGRAETLA